MKGIFMIENFTPENQKTRSPYSQVKKIDLGNCYLIFVAGTQPPAGQNKIVLTDDITEQAKQVFEHIAQSLAMAGATMDNVVDAVLYFADIRNDFDAVSAVRNEYFKNSKPTSTCASVNGFSRVGAKIEIKVTAILPK
jgi:enamine deaminase RidA (YjgF/YER057c/UK114 family)